jgi:chromatin segregation and condensation protein Rec8/ScpA/Scc1 (kleisin family)
MSRRLRKQALAVTEKVPSEETPPLLDYFSRYEKLLERSEDEQLGSEAQRRIEKHLKRFERLLDKLISIRIAEGWSSVARNIAATLAFLAVATYTTINF